MNTGMDAIVDMRAASAQLGETIQRSRFRPLHTTERGSQKKNTSRREYHNGARANSM